MMVTIRSHCRPVLIGGLFVVCFLLCRVPVGYSQSLPSPPPARARGQSAISVDAEMVLLPVRVTDAKGAFVSGLSQQDFRVYQDGQLQQITMFQREDKPVTVGLVVDHSRSMGPKLPEVVAAVSAFAQSSNPRDEMFVVDFNDRVSLELFDGQVFHRRPRGTCQGRLARFRKRTDRAI